MIPNRPQEPYVVRHLLVRDGVSCNTYDVIHLGPYVVAKGLKEIEARSLAAALNKENKDR